MKVFEIEVRQLDGPDKGVVAKRHFTVRGDFAEEGTTICIANKGVDEDGGDELWVEFAELPETLDVDEAEWDFARAIQAVSSLASAGCVLSKQVVEATLTYSDQEDTPDP